MIIGSLTFGKHLDALLLLNPPSTLPAPFLQIDRAQLDTTVYVWRFELVLSRRPHEGRAPSEPSFIPMPGQPLYGPGAARASTPRRPAWRGVLYEHTAALVRRHRRPAE